jgi:hypothetical protein
LVVAVECLELQTLAQYQHQIQLAVASSTLMLAHLNIAVHREL